MMEKQDNMLEHGLLDQHGDLCRPVVLPETTTEISLKVLRSKHCPYLLLQQPRAKCYWH